VVQVDALALALISEGILMYANLAILAAFVLLYSLVSGGLEKTSFNGAVVFMAFGLVLGPLGLGLLTLEVDAELLSTLAELTLAMVLFTDASNANQSSPRRLQDTKQVI